MKTGSVLVFLFLLSNLGAAPWAGAKEPAAKTEELLHRYPSAVFKFDFEGSGQADDCVVSCEKVKDYSRDPNDKVKKIWYQFRIRITSKKGRELFKDVYASNEKDYREIFERWTGGDAPDPKDYVRKYFKIKMNVNAGTLNGYELGTIGAEEIDTDGVAETIKDEKADTTVEKVTAELTKGKHMILSYFGEWAEDVRIYVYSRELGAPVRLLNEYELH